MNAITHIYRTARAFSPNARLYLAGTS